MEKPKRPYSLFKRPTVKANTFIYYCRFRDENGDYMSPISTLQFSKAAARQFQSYPLRTRLQAWQSGKNGATERVKLETEITLVQHGVVGRVEAHSASEEWRDIARHGFHPDPDTAEHAATGSFESPRG